MKRISLKIHGFIDYFIVLFLILSPSIFDFYGTGAGFTYALGFIHLGLTVFSDFPLGLVKVIPIRVHGQIELAVSVLLLILSFTVFNPDKKLEVFYLILSISILLVWVLTNYKEQTFSGKLLS
jgi:hypothetical protein